MISIDFIASVYELFDNPSYTSYAFVQIVSRQHIVWTWILRSLHTDTDLATSLTSAKMAELVTSFLLGFVGFLIYICFWKLSIPKMLPPGPRILPFIGNVYPLFGTKDVLKSFHALRRKYGDIFTLTIGGKYFVIVNGYDTFREIFIDKGDFVSNGPDNFMSKEITQGNGNSRCIFMKYKILEMKKTSLQVFLLFFIRHCLLIWPSMES